MRSINLRPKGILQIHNSGFLLLKKRFAGSAFFCLPGKKTRHVKASGYFGEREGYAGEFGIKYKF